MYLGNAAAAAQYKFIYSFHMPLFFVLSGFIAKDWAAEQSLGRFLKTRLTSRIVPLIFFNLLLVVLSFIAPRDFPPFPLDSAEHYLGAAISSLLNLPIFNVPTWFLMCLVSVEVLHFIFFRFLRGSDMRIVAAIVVFYAVGFVANREFDFVRLMDPFRWNWWFLNEAVTMYAFYVLGVMLRRRGVFATGEGSRWLYAGFAVAGFAIVAATYGLNEGPFRLNIDAVVILVAAHGDALWFPITAVIGSLAVLCLARALPPYRWITYMGANALTLFCLNGVFYHHINGPLAAWFTASLPRSGVSVAFFFAAATAVSLALTVPVVILLNRYLPQLIGRPTVSGPILPRLQ